MNIAIIGAGSIGNKRVESLPPKINLGVVCDLNYDKAQKLASKYNALAQKDWKRVVSDPKVSAIFICTTHNNLAKIAVKAITQGKHVLIEKPGGISEREIKQIQRAHKSNPVVVMFGYNHRFHPAIEKANKIIQSKSFGKILFIRAKYGHGGRLGYEKEWRFKKNISGGGELIDQGSHLIDLVNFFNGKMNVKYAAISTFFWNTKLEDTAFFLLSNSQNQQASLSASCVEWKNLFCFEIMLQKGKLQIDGLGRSYGVETLTIYKMRKAMGPPDVKVLTFDKPDDSWLGQNREFFKRIARHDYSTNSIDEANYVMKTIDAIYSQK